MRACLTAAIMDMHAVGNISYSDYIAVKVHKYIHTVFIQNSREEVDSCCQNMIITYKALFSIQLYHNLLL